MRDTNTGMIELIDVDKTDDIYSATIKHNIGGEMLILKFGINTEDYINLKRIFQFKPFLNSGSGRYSYYFTMSYLKDDDNITTAYIRVEQLNIHKHYGFKVSKKLMANLLWFYTIENKSQIEEMIIK